MSRFFNAHPIQGRVFFLLFEPKCLTLILEERISSFSGWMMTKGESMSKSFLPKNTKELIDDIDREWSALMHVADRLTPEQMITPDVGGWSPKDNLAHLTEWMKILLGHHMDRRAPEEVTGLPPEATREWDMDQMNRLLLARNLRRPPEEVVEELKRVYAEVIARLKATPFEELMEPRHADDPEKQPLIKWVLANTSGHFSEHRFNIEKMLNQ
jgi:hypothetical protein